MLATLLQNYCTIIQNYNILKLNGNYGIRTPVRIWKTSMQNLAGSALFLPQGGKHFQLVPLGSPPQGYFMSKFSPLTSIKFLPPMPPIQK